MILEFQVRAETLCSLVRNNLLSRPICISIAGAKDKPPEEIVDRVELWRTGLIRNDAGVVQLVQPVVCVRSDFATAVGNLQPVSHMVKQVYEA